MTRVSLECSTAARSALARRGLGLGRSRRFAIPSVTVDAIEFIALNAAVDDRKQPPKSLTSPTPRLRGNSRRR